MRFQKAGSFRKAIERYAEARLQATDPSQVSRAWRLEAFANHGVGAWEDALAAAQQSEEIARSIDRGDLIAEALNARAAVHYARGDLADAETLYREMLGCTAEPRVQGLALQNLAIVEGRRGGYTAAERYLNQAFERFGEAGYAWGQAHVLNNLVGLALDREEYGEAVAGARRAMTVAREVDDLELVAITTLNLAESLAGLGHVEEAELQASTALGHFQRSGNPWRRVACLRLLGDLHERQADPETAARFWRTGLDVAEEIGAEEEAAELRERLTRGRAET